MVARLHISIDTHRRLSPLRAISLELLFSVAGFASVAWAASSTMAPQELEIGGLQVEAWIPDRATPGPWPVLIFSHGFDGCNIQSTFLTETLARSGYAVFAPNHQDAGCGGILIWPTRPDAPFRDPGDWTENTYKDRRDDIRKLLDALSADPRYSTAPFDWNHVGLIGHSLGGYTVLGLAGAWPSWKDPRIKAVLALSPYAAPFVLHHSLDGIDIPVMYQGGTRDFGITPSVKKRGGAYDQTKSEKYFVEFDGVGHFAWTDLRDSDHAGIVEYSRAFLDHSLKGGDFPKSLAVPRKDVTAIRVSG